MITKVVFKFILPLMIFAAVMASLSSITNQSLEPRHDSLIDQLNEFNREVHIGEKDSHNSEDAEKIFRGVTAFNMLSAQNCLYPSLLYVDTPADIDANPDASGLNSDSKTLLKNLVAEQKPWDEVMADKFNDHPEKARFSFGINYDNSEENLLRFAVSESEDFSGTCMGASPIPLADGDFWSLVPSNFGMIHGYAACVASTLACGIATVNLITGTLGLSAKDTHLDAFEGHSAQGVFGKQRFVIDQNFTIEHPELMALDLGKTVRHNSGFDINLDEDFLKPGSSPSPDFTRGARGSIYIPDGIVTNDNSNSFMEDEIQDTTVRNQKTALIGFLEERDASKEFPVSFSRYAKRRGVMPYHEFNKNDADWKQTMNAFRVRMDGVPIVVDDNMRDLDDISSSLYANDHLEGHEVTESPENFEDIFNNIESDSEDKFTSDKRTRMVTMRNQYEFMVKNVDYYLCDGLKGSFQSNAKDIDHSGKPVSSLTSGSELRDVVFPEIEIDWESSNTTRSECRSEAVNEIHGTTDYEMFYGDGLDWFSGTTPILIPD